MNINYNPVHFNRTFIFFFFVKIILIIVGFHDDIYINTHEFELIGNRLLFYGINDFYQQGRSDITGPIDYDESFIQNPCVFRSENDEVFRMNKIIFSKVIVTERHTLIITDNSTVFGMGNGGGDEFDYSLMGDSVTRNTEYPVMFYSPKNYDDQIKNISVSENGIYFTTNNNRLYGYGVNHYRFVENDYSIVIPFPELIENYVTHFSISYYIGMMSTDGLNVFTRGDNEYYQTGHPLHSDTYTRPSFESINSSFAYGIGIKELASFYHYTWIVLNDNSFYGFGTCVGSSYCPWVNCVNFRQQSPIEVNIYTPLGDVQVNEDVISFVCGYRACFILTNENHIYSWGSLTAYYIGRYFTGDGWKYPKTIAMGELVTEDKIKTISTSRKGTHILTEDGKVFVFGYNANSFILTGEKSSGWNQVLNFEILKEYEIISVPKIQYYHYAFSFFDISCFGEWRDSSNVCSSSGNCTSQDACSCESGYSGENCEHSSCFGLSDKLACSSNGICTGLDTCLCMDFYSGKHCNITECFGDFSTNETAVCSNHGQCVLPNKCLCNELYEGKLCSELKRSFFVKFWYYIIFPAGGIVLLLLLIILFTIIFYCVCRKQSKKISKFSELKDFDVLLQEQKAEETSGGAKFKINKSLYEINYSDVELVKELGRGGSQTVVYLGNWRKEQVAVKVFRTSFLKDQSNYNDFENELSLVSSLSSPFIVRFFGACIYLPRICLVFQYCKNGDLRSYLDLVDMNNNNERNPNSKVGLEFEEKIRILHEISKGVFYLHDKRILHRDLKCANILLDDSLQAKIIDFGISKLIKNEYTELTKRLGTSYYISPQVILSGKYSFKADVFSFSMIIYETITQKYAFGRDAQIGIEMAISNKPNFRPKMTKLIKQKCFKSNDWLIDLVSKCWQHSESDRPSFKQIESIFSDKMKRTRKASNLKEMKLTDVDLKRKIIHLEKENIKLKEDIKKIKK